MSEFTLRVDGMHCGACIRRVSQALAGAEGFEVKEVRIGAARVTTEEGAEAVDRAVAALAKAGYPAHLEQTGEVGAPAGH
jgi:copper chaperone CopZ